MELGFPNFRENRHGKTLRNIPNSHKKSGRNLTLFERMFTRHHNLTWLPENHENQKPPCDNRPAKFTDKSGLTSTPIFPPPPPLLPHPVAFRGRILFYYECKYIFLLSDVSLENQKSVFITRKFFIKFSLPLFTIILKIILLVKLYKF